MFQEPNRELEYQIILKPLEQDLNCRRFPITAPAYNCIHAIIEFIML